MFFFVATKACLSRQTRVCRDKIILLATTVLSRQKTCARNTSFVATKMILVEVPANDRKQGGTPTKTGKRQNLRSLVVQIRILKTETRTD